MISYKIKEDIIDIIKLKYDNVYDAFDGFEIGNNSIIIVVSLGDDNLESFPAATYLVESEIKITVIVQNGTLSEMNKAIDEFYTYAVNSIEPNSVNNADTIFVTSIERGEYSNSPVDYTQPNMYDEVVIANINLVSTARV